VFKILKKQFALLVRFYRAGQKWAATINTRAERIEDALPHGRPAIQTGHKY
jgi:hypothetical protein